MQQEPAAGNEKLPAPQPTHVKLEVAPVVPEYVPPAQSSQELAPTALLYLPTEHGVHEPATGNENLPAPQLTHVKEEVAPVVPEYVPPAQSSQVAAEVAPTALLYLPTEHGVQVELPANEYVPGGHEVVPVAPARASCVAGPVAVHVVEASMVPLYTEW